MLTFPILGGRLFCVWRGGRDEGLLGATAEYGQKKGPRKEIAAQGAFSNLLRNRRCHVGR